MTSLRQRMIEDMQVRHLSPNTERAYVETVARFARHFGRSPAVLGPDEIRAYQVCLTTKRRLAPSSLVIAVSALRFLYKVTLKQPWSFDDVIPTPKKPRTLPIVLSPDEVVRFLDCLTSLQHRTILTTCYAAGLRISEAVCLTVSAIDSGRMVLRVAQGKGQQDRYVMLSPTLPEILRVWWRLHRPTHWLSRAVGGTTRSAGAPSSTTVTRRGNARASPNPSLRIRCVTRLPSICSSPAPTCVRFRYCSAIATSAPPRAICASPPPRCARPRPPAYSKIIEGRIRDLRSEIAISN